MCDMQRAVKLASMGLCDVGTTSEIAFLLHTHPGRVGGIRFVGCSGPQTITMACVELCKVYTLTKVKLHTYVEL